MKQKNRIRNRIISIAVAAAFVFAQACPAFAEESAQTGIAATVKAMSTEDKITQTMMMDFRTWGTDDDNHDMTSLDSDVRDIISKYRFGSVILFKNNIKETEDTLALTKDLQAAAVSGGGLPLLIATDQEGGKVYRLGSGTALPGNMAIAATDNIKYAEEAGSIIGRELESVGINVSLAPVMDVNNNANNSVIKTRSFSDDADIVSLYGGAVIKAMSEQGIIGCAKHFPGHGDTETDSHYNLPIVDKSLEELKATELKPFQQVIDKGADMIMTAHILYPQVDDTELNSEKTGATEKRPATLSNKIITGLLKGEMGFGGVVLTDAMNMDSVTKMYSEPEAFVYALEAGADMICMPAAEIHTTEEAKSRIDALIDATEAAIENGDLTEDRLNDAVTRILALKQAHGILDYNPDNYTVERALQTVGSSENRAMEREMSARAVTVVKNRNNTLPLRVNSKSHVLMMAPYSNEPALMAMGWNRAKAAGLIPDGAQVKTYVYSSSDYLVEGALKKALDWADAVIINSEISSPTAMAFGNYLSAGPKNCTEYCADNGKKSVVVSVDTPYDVQLYRDADAVMAVYGCIGSSLNVEDVIEKGITESEEACGPNIIAGVEVALGVYGATGKLPVVISAFDSASKKYTSRTIYERGFGIDTPKAEKTVTVKATKIRKLQSLKRGLKVTVAKVSSKYATGYQVKYSLKKNMKNARVKNMGRNTSKKILKLKKHRRYYVKVRSVLKANGTVQHSKWSSRKAIRTR